MISLHFSPDLYPACAPLPVPMADHLLSQEANRYANKKQPIPGEEDLIITVLARIARARHIVYGYLDPFVQSDKRKQQINGGRREFPTVAFLLDELEAHAPNDPKNPGKHIRYTEKAVSYWQSKGLIHRSDGEEHMDIHSMAAVIVARIVEPDLQRNWLVPRMEKDEPRWWCYVRSSPSADVKPLALPYTLNTPSDVLWTPWRGASWESDAWQAHGKRYLFRWSGEPSLDQLRIWNGTIPNRIDALAGDELFFLRKNTVQSVLLDEARSSILANVAQEQKGDRYESTRLYY